MTQQRTIDARIIGFTTVAIVLGIGFATAMSAYAATEPNERGYGNGRGTCTSEQHEAVEAAIEAGDYDLWKELMDGRGRISEVVTEENFDTFVEMHTAMEEGDEELAAEKRTALGLGVRAQDGSGRGAGKMHRRTGMGDRNGLGR